MPISFQMYLVNEHPALHRDNGNLILLSIAAAYRVGCPQQLCDCLAITAQQQLASTLHTAL